jgi:hypothetical protein
MSIGLLISLFSIIAVGALYYFDLLSSKKVLHQMMKHSMVLCREWQGDMKHIGSQFQEMEKELSDKLSRRDSILFGVYFDDPKRLIDTKQARCMIGFILETEIQKRVGQEIVNQNSKYKTGVLPETMTLTLKYKYRNPLSFFLLGHFWKKVMNHFHFESLKRQENTPYIEVYDLRDRGDSHIHLHYPLENFQQLNLSSIPKPASLDLSK